MNRGFWLAWLLIICLICPNIALAKEAETFPVQMKVDFGPAGKPAYDDMIEVEKGTTPKEAVSQVFPVLSGKACCSFREVIEINDVRVDPEKKLWWICLLNGSKNVSPQKKKLKAGDVVEWKYIQDSPSDSLNYSKRSKS